MSKSPITCHVLDSSLGKPAPGVRVSLYEHSEPSEGSRPSILPSLLAEGETDADGRCLNLLPSSQTVKTGGVYKLVFETRDYFARTNTASFYPWVEIAFRIADNEEHYHVPLLISPFSYTTYRGS